MNEEYDIHYLSYSGWKCYNDCPLQYLKKYIEEVPFDSDPRGSFFGTAIGKCFELFYVREYWKRSDMVDATLSTVRESLLYTLEKNKFVPDRETDRDLIKDIKQNLIECIPIGIDIIRKHKLLSEYTKCEFKLDITYKSNSHDFAIRMGGKPDFIHGMKTPWIIDGKGGSKEYVDNFQLIWYATQHFLKFRVAPERIGFIFWKHPDDPMVWVDYEEHDIRYCVKQVYSTVSNIRLKMFVPKVSKKCSYCPYSSQCPEGKEYIESIDIDNKSRVDIDGSILQISDS